ncbi:MAG: hypothetical protein MZW92_38035 [Comamonadaceae bacterium]|nr:hypothetical protein [Comamonadaceae bacterium]
MLSLLHRADRPRLLHAAAGARVPAHRRAGGRRSDHATAAPRPRSSSRRSPSRWRTRSPASRASTCMTSHRAPEQQPDHGALQARAQTPTPPPPTCATASRACAAGCPTAVDEPVIAKVEADATPIIWLAFTSEHACRRWRSPTSSTASSSRGCRRCPASADVRDLRRAASTRCASGSTATGWPPTS